MQVCVLRNVLGESKHLLYDLDNKSFRWVSKPPKDCWIFGNPDADQSIDRLCELLGKKIPIVPSGAFGRMVKELRHIDPDVPLKWRYLLPDHEFQPFIKGIIEGCTTALETGDISYYTDIFKRTTRFLESLERARVNEDKLYDYYAAERNETVKSTLRSCFPDHEGFAKQVSYKQASTVTGRLTVREGPRILILPKAYRDSFRSRYEGGSIGMIDYRSLEPRIALLEVGRPTPEDIYADIDEQLFGNSIERDRVKVMSIATLYGAQEATMRKLSGLVNGELHNAMDGLVSYFEPIRKDHLAAKDNTKPSLQLLHSVHCG